MNTMNDVQNSVRSFLLVLNNSAAIIFGNENQFFEN